jgi:hypothetical protein
MIPRLEGWEIRLGKFLQARAHLPFAWGTNDCLIFAADAVEEMTDVDPAARWRGYTTKEQAAALLEHGGGVEGLITTGLGSSPHRHYRLARRGDITLADCGHGPTGCVVDDSGARLIAVTEEGLRRLPLKEAVLVWSF